jgi:nitrate reductase molybdenum cofactor assembly chaperone NarJ/NarW
MWITVGPNIKNGYGTKGVHIPGNKVYKELLDRLILVTMSRLLTYPDSNFLDERSSIEEFISEYLSSAKIRKEVLKSINPLYEMMLKDLQELYVETFDYKEEANLYLTAHELGDSRKRGAALIKLQKLICESGYDYEGKDLADYIPMDV